MPFFLGMSSSTVAVAILAFIVTVDLSSGSRVIPSTDEFLDDKNAVTPNAATDALLSELAAEPDGEKARRLNVHMESLRPMYNALPKTKDGKLSAATARYALHRLLVKVNGWYVKGVEPDGGARNASTTPLEEWVPRYFQWYLDMQKGTGGLSLKDTAVVAVSLEDLANNEAIGFLRSVYRFWSVDEEVNVKISDDLYHPNTTWRDIRQMYMAAYLLEANLTKENQKVRIRYLRDFRKEYPDIERLEEWMAGLDRVIQPEAVKRDHLSFQEASTIVQQVGMQYASAINNQECNSLKHFMFKREDPERPGRMLLSEFYRHGGLNAERWEFGETPEYLRDLGALDDSTPEKPAVIIPNYVSSKPQCLQNAGNSGFRSTIYDMCCQNECEKLLGDIEAAVQKPFASVKEITSLVEKLGSDTVLAPRKISPTLSRRLDAVATINGGKIPLHGRLFAQWMHHAYPRECPYPHEAGTTSPRAPNEWMGDGSKGAALAEEELMRCHVHGDCPGGAKAVSAAAPAAAKQRGDPEEHLAWTDTEELLVRSDEEL